MKHRTREVFEKFDKNNSGIIEFNKAESFMKELDPMVTNANVQKAINDMNQDNNVEITYEEFKSSLERVSSFCVVVVGLIDVASSRRRSNPLFPPHPPPPALVRQSSK